MFVEEAANWGDPVQMVTPLLLMVVLVSLIVLILPSNFLDRLAGRFEGAGMLSAGAMFACALVLVDVVLAGGTAVLGSF